MLNYDGMIRLALWIVLIVGLVGCGKKTTKPIDPESLPLTFSQILIVNNKTSDEVHVFPAPGLTGEPLALKSGESITMNFMINRKASLDESGNPTEGGWAVEIDKQHKFLGMGNPDGLLRIKTSKGELWDYRIVLGNCWFENKPPTEDHELVVNERGPDKGTSAVVLCN